MSGHRLGLAALAVVGLAAIAGPLAEAKDLPPAGARPGECYGKVILPPVYGSTKERVLKRGAWTETRRGRAVVERTTERVLVQPAHIRRVKLPAVYRTEVVWVKAPGRRVLVTEPAEYEVVREKVVLEPGHAEWRRQSAALAYGETSYGRQTIVEPTGEVLCRVWVPARYGYVSRKVMVSPGRAYEEVGPARRYKQVRKIKVRDGGWTEKRVPAVYKTRVVEKVIRRGPARTIQHPAVYGVVEKPKLLREEGAGWARVLCGGAINPAFMARVQEALIDRGFDPGPPDGVARPQTYAALRMFQRRQGLAQGQLTEESARALGLR